MQIRKFYDDTVLKNIPPHIMGIDLELANSFQSEPPVICMIGLQYYEPDRQRSCTTIASITTREEENTIVDWLLQRCQAFYNAYPQGKLLSFSGLDNDMRWLNQRLERMGIPAPEQTALNQLAHIDLKIEFFHRTQNSQISLKKLEEIFGIQRDSTTSSKKVSYILTDLVRKNQQDKGISKTLYHYLREDVHNMFIIYDRWQQISLNGYNLTDEDVHQLVVSMIRTVDKFIHNPRLRNGFQPQCAALRAYQRKVQAQLKRVETEESFANFTLPALPALQLPHPDFARIRKKHAFLDGLEMVDPCSGNYRLKRTLFRPKGALAVVWHEERLLMIRRADAVKRAPGRWGLPGGVLEKGENPQACAVRELREEVNLEGRPLRILGSSPSFNGEYELIWVEVAVDDVSTVRPNPAEVAMVRWVQPGDVGHLKPLIPGVLENFSRLLGSNWGD